MIVNIAVPIVLALLVVAWIWLMRRYHARWWITATTGLLLTVFVLSFFRG